MSNLYLLTLSKQLKFSVLPLIIMLPVFPSWVDEIAKSRPDMNIKVTAFTESKKWSKLTKTENVPYLTLLILR